MTSTLLLAHMESKMKDLRNELPEVALRASIVAGLLILGVGLAVSLVMVP
jgi:hypothetical protein